MSPVHDEVSTAPASVGITGQNAPTRIASIDIFRGLTMVVMIFVNDLSSVHGLSKWTYHMPAQVDAMTYVDMVFPFFLFTVGLSLPLAIKARLRKGSTMLSLWAHILLRVLGLLVLGLILANAERGDPAKMGMPSSVWALLALLGAVLFWAVYNPSSPRARFMRYLRYGGLAILVVAFALFRRTTKSGQTAWIDFSYPEILGLIAFAYLSVCLLYIPFRRWRFAPIAWFSVLLAFCAASTAHLLRFPNHTPLYYWPFGNGSMPCIAMAGVVTSTIFLGNAQTATVSQKILRAFSFGAASLIAGWFMIPLGISKIRATPTWCLFSIGAAVLLFTLVYWVSDVRRRTGWAAPVRPAGSNTLLTYLVPDVYYYIASATGFTYLESHFASGVPGIARAVAFTVAMLLIAAMLTRARVRLQL